MRIGKYAFDSKEQAETKIKALGTATDMEGNETPSHPHTIVHLGNIVLVAGEYDAEGEEVKAPILSDKYHLDVLWIGLETHPRGWKSYAVDMSKVVSYENEEGETITQTVYDDGVHGFMGLSYSDYKI
jgi:hypothetical protein